MDVDEDPWMDDACGTVGGTGEEGAWYIKIKGRRLRKVRAGATPCPFDALTSDEGKGGEKGNKRVGGRCLKWG